MSGTAATSANCSKIFVTQKLLATAPLLTLSSYVANATNVSVTTTLFAPPAFHFRTILVVGLRFAAASTVMSTVCSNLNETSFGVESAFL
jgi:hypothetical protein